MKNKIYSKPIVEAIQLVATANLLTGSPGALQNSGSGTDNLGGGDVIGN